MNIKFQISCILFVVVFILAHFLYGAFSAAILHLILCCLLFLVRRDVRYDALLVYNIGAIFAICIYFYWSMDSGSGYFLGKLSDDWHYDVLWSQEYFQDYGINPIYLRQYFPLHNSKGYVYFIVLLRWFSELFGGYHTLIARFANVFFLTLISVYSFRLMKVYSCKNRISYVAFYFVFFFPTNIFLSVHIFRDTIVALIIITFFYYVTHVRRKKYIFVVIILLFTIFTFRIGSFMLLLATLPFLLLETRHQKMRFIFLCLILIAGTVFYFSSEVLYIVSSIGRYDVINIDRRGDFGSKIFALPPIAGLIPRMLYLLFTPVPKLSSFWQFFTSISAFLQVIFFPFLFFSLYKNYINFKIRIYFLCFFLAVAFTTATFRHELQYIPFGILLVCVFSDKHGLKIDRLYFVALFGIFTGFSLSIILAYIW